MRKEQKALILVVMIGVVAIINFCVYALVADYLGGDAINGKIESGRYYLGSHGHYTEVSRRIFIYSKLHTYAVWVTHSMMFIGAAIIHMREKRQGRSEGGPAA